MIQLYQGNCLDILPTLDSDSVHCCVTSPPYFRLRDYQAEGQIGQEATLQAYIEMLVRVFAEVRRVLKPDGSLWLNLGDSFSGGERCFGGLAKKQLLGVPWRVAFALQADGWILRSEVIWNKSNCLPESVRDRPTKAHETLFLLTKRSRYYYNQAAVAVPLKASTQERMKRGDRVSGKYASNGKGDDLHIAAMNVCRKRSFSATHANRRSVWTLGNSGTKEKHFAAYPEKLVEPCLLASCPPGGTVLDVFAGTGTTGVVAQKFGRSFVGIELNPEYHAIMKRRLGIV